MTDPLGVALPRSTAEPWQQRETRERDEVARKNREALLRLVAKHDLWIRKDDFDNWRPTVRESGEITGVKAGLTIIATDGNVAYFEDENDFDVFFGHIQCFTGEVRTLYSLPKEHKSAVIKPATRKLSAAEKLLKQIQARFAQEPHGG